MCQHARLTSLLVFAALLGVGCAQGELHPDPSVDPPDEPQVWLPDDGLPVPASVANRAPLRWCGVEVVIEGERRTGDLRQSSRCVLAALRAGAAAEMVVEARDRRTGKSILFIVRARPDATEVVRRSTVPGLPPLWELERCGRPTDAALNDELGGRLFGDLLLIPGCGALTRIVD